MGPHLISSHPLRSALSPGVLQTSVRPSPLFPSVSLQYLYLTTSPATGNGSEDFMLRRMSLCRSPLINVVPPLPRYCHSPSHDAPWRLWWATAAAMADDTMGRLIDGQKIVRLSGCWRHEPGKTLSPATPIHVHAYHVFADIP